MPQSFTEFEQEREEVFNREFCPTVTHIKMDLLHQDRLATLEWVKSQLQEMNKDNCTASDVEIAAYNDYRQQVLEILNKAKE